MFKEVRIGLKKNITLKISLTYFGTFKGQNENKKRLNKNNNFLF
ncbi:hypothetical protein HMPREF3187_00152 [Aerococcus christensenii]|uniref:Uncharacterized protein n=1 Tax=Aerococcus christensenii TaxID=87541 RepID=A0A133Y4E2_9LACT|nr:hypothetical protein HMPREF3187_00152 [Aerococcus christensenii]